MMLRALLPLLLVAPLTLAEDAPDPNTLLLPESCDLFARLPSLDRLDMIGRELQPFVGMADKDAGDFMKRLPLSASFVISLGLDATDPFDRSLPLYVGLIEGKPLWCIPLEAGGKFRARPLARGRTGVQRGSMLCVGEPAVHQLPLRESALPLLNGDVTVKVLIDRLVQKNKESIDNALAGAAKGLGEIPLLPAMPADKVVAPVRDLVYGVRSLDYALHWKNGKLETEGLLRVKDGARLRAFFGRAGQPGGNPLSGYLPKDSMFAFDYVGNPDWPGRELLTFAKDVLGQDLGDAAGRVFMSQSHLWEHLSGRMAGGVSAELMNVSSTTIAEGKPGSDLNAEFLKVDPDAIVAALKRLGMEGNYVLEPRAATHGGVEIHKTTTTIGFGQAAGLQQQEQISYTAVVNNLLLSVSGNDPLPDIKALIDRVQKGEKGAHTHGEAVNRLARSHTLAFTTNLSAFKPFGMFVVLAGEPEIGQAMALIPNSVTMTTVATIRDGHLQWRGDWPVTDAARFMDRYLDQKAILEQMNKPVQQEEDFE